MCFQSLRPTHNSSLNTAGGLVQLQKSAPKKMIHSFWIANPKSAGHGLQIRASEVHCTNFAFLIHHSSLFTLHSSSAMRRAFLFFKGYSSQFVEGFDSLVDNLGRFTGEKIYFWTKTGKYFVWKMKIALFYRCFRG